MCLALGGPKAKGRLSYREITVQAALALCAPTSCFDTALPADRLQALRVDRSNASSHSLNARAVGHLADNRRLLQRRFERRCALDREPVARRRRRGTAPQKLLCPRAVTVRSKPRRFRVSVDGAVGAWLGRRRGSVLDASIDDKTYGIDIRVSPGTPNPVPNPTYCDLTVDPGSFHARPRSGGYAPQH